MRLGCFAKVPRRDCRCRLLVPQEERGEVGGKTAAVAGVSERRQNAPLRQVDEGVPMGGPVGDWTLGRAAEVTERAGDPPPQLGL